MTEGLTIAHTAVKVKDIKGMIKLIEGETIEQRLVRKLLRNHRHRERQRKT